MSVAITFPFTNSIIIIAPLLVLSYMLSFRDFFCHASIKVIFLCVQTYYILVKVL